MPARPAAVKHVLMSFPQAGGFRAGKGDAVLYRPAVPIYERRAGAIPGPEADEELFLNAFSIRLGTYYRLGFPNLLRLALYRARMKGGWYRLSLPVAVDRGGSGAFFLSERAGQRIEGLQAAERDAILGLADGLLEGRFLAFGRHVWPVAVPPDWLAYPVSRRAFPHSEAHWSDIPDFSGEGNDIKTVWELSRCEWAVQLAMAVRIGGDDRYLQALEGWLSDWDARNPPNRGPNWKCGQETSLRLLHVLLAQLVLENGAVQAATPRLREFVRRHLARIEATLSYAIAQDNNHGTSEAAALFIGGHWLLRVTPDPSARQRRTYARWARIGRRNLEERVARLVLADGTFSQYSPTYQRVLLATINQALVWQAALGLPAFSDRFMARAAAALEWLAQLVEPATGDAPNLGANDGANVFRLSWREDYRDFRAALAALAHRLGIAGRTYGLEDAAALWLPDAVRAGPAPAGAPGRFSSVSMGQGGFEKIAAADGRSWALLRTARFRFRPPHADVNHVDLWANGVNILMDSGSYSYAAPIPGEEHALKTAFHHNVATFDDRDQMPALGRFLYGAWPHARVSRDKGANAVESVVRFADGNSHGRRLSNPGPARWQVTDRLEGPFGRATLRWHLPDREWKFAREGELVSAAASIRISAAAGNELEIVTRKTFVSRYYLDLEPCVVLEVSIGRMGNTRQAVEIETVITLNEEPGQS